MEFLSRRRFLQIEVKESVAFRSKRVSNRIRLHLFEKLAQARRGISRVSMIIVR